MLVSAQVIRDFSRYSNVLWPMHFFFTVWAMTFYCSRSHCCFCFVVFFSDSEESLSLQLPCLHFCSLTQSTTEHNLSKKQTSNKKTQYIIREITHLALCLQSLLQKQDFFFLSLVIGCWALLPPIVFTEIS